MKTPRDLLLEHHAGADSRLDAIRPEDLAACARIASAALLRQPSPRSLQAILKNIWRECIAPWRRLWVGIVAIWVLILGFDASTRPAPRIVLQNTPPMTPEVRMVLREQRQLMAQLLESEPPSQASYSKPAGPRSQRGPSGQLHHAAVEDSSSPGAPEPVTLLV